MKLQNIMVAKKSALQPSIGGMSKLKVLSIKLCYIIIIIINPVQLKIIIITKKIKSNRFIIVLIIILVSCIVIFLIY
jgi:hypothetical protein